MTAPADKIWAYLQNELSPDEAARFERALTEDSALREAFKERRATHEELAKLDQEVLSDEQLEEQLLAEWVAEHPEYAEKTNPRTRRNILRFSIPLAAAAAIVILLARPSDPIRWQRTVYGSAPQLRGEPAAQPQYTRADLKLAARKLQDAVNSTCNPPDKWTLQIHLQELAGGALAVEVSGRSRETSKVWTENFQSLETFHQNVPRVGNQIVDDL